MDIPACYVSYERGFFHVLFGTLMALMLLILGWLGWLVLTRERFGAGGYL